MSTDPKATVPLRKGFQHEFDPDVVRAHLVPGETWWG